MLACIQTLAELGAVNAAEVLEMWEKVGIPASARNEMEKVKSYFKEYFKENEDTSKYIKGLALCQRLADPEDGTTQDCYGQLEA